MSLLRPVVPATYQRRNEVVAGQAEPLTWSHGTRYWSGHPMPAVNLRCDRGHLAMLGDRHEVSPDGQVTPSVGCPSPGCGWHAWARLAEWTPPEPT